MVAARPRSQRDASVPTPSRLHLLARTHSDRLTQLRASHLGLTARREAVPPARHRLRHAIATPTARPSILVGAPRAAQRQRSVIRHSRSAPGAAASAPRRKHIRIPHVLCPLQRQRRHRSSVRAPSARSHSPRPKQGQHTEQLARPAAAQPLLQRTHPSRAQQPSTRRAARQHAHSPHLRFARHSDNLILPAALSQTYPAGLQSWECGGCFVWGSAGMTTEGKMR
mmetsp:Transcript_11524/g.34129  ORF Transcript_11524/g.34129 Transcript_11524/m.34129 type:complete len:225 (-) Transcript_11524:73-747(-)